MALRPFARNPKPGDEEATDEDSSNEVEQFFSAERRRQQADPADPVPPDGAGAATAPPVSPPVHGEPGWYPDDTDPGLMRYWDGFHLTGQVVHVHTRSSDAEGGTQMPEAIDVHEPPADPPVRPSEDRSAPDSGFSPSAVSLPTLHKEEDTSPAPALTLVGPVAGDVPVVAASSLGSAESEPESPTGSPGAQDAAPAATAPEPAPTGRSDPDPVGTVESDEDEDEGDGADRTHPDSRVGSPSAAPGRVDVAGEARKWAQEAEKAVTRATSAGSPDAWQEAARLAVVVSEMAQTLQAAAEADQMASQMAEAAQEASQQAQAAAQKSADADRAVERARQSAQEADDAAKRARQSAVDAQEAAAQASQAVPKFVEKEKAAAQVAAEAQRKAQCLGEIVGQARSADTPSAWSEALRQATAAVGDHPVPEPRTGDTRVGHAMPSASAS